MSRVRQVQRDIIAAMGLMVAAIALGAVWFSLNGLFIALFAVTIFAGAAQFLSILQLWKFRCRACGERIFNDGILCEHPSIFSA